MLIRHLLRSLAVVVLSLPVLAAPAQAAPARQPAPVQQAAPTGCTTWVEWVQSGSSYWHGKGNVQCATGRYKAKNVCRNLQTGVAYVLYGSQIVNAPGTATVTCFSGNDAEAVYAVEDPPPAGVTGCAGWMEWVHEGSNHWYGRGRVQCDTGQYKVRVQCRNLQTGVGYVLYGPVVSAPNVSTTTCFSGNVAESVSAVPQ